MHPLMFSVFTKKEKEERDLIIQSLSMSPQKEDPGEENPSGPIKRQDSKKVANLEAFFENDDTDDTQQQV
jgi:hypothetical protein